MRRLALLPIIAVLLLLHSAPVQAAGQLDVVGKFFANGVELDIATYTEGTQKVGLIGIATTTQRASVAFSPGEWDSFVNLWQNAAKLESDSWQLIGSFKEPNTKEQDLLIVTAGLGVQFTIMNRTSGTSSFVLAKSDFGTLDAKVRQVTEYLAR